MEVIKRIVFDIVNMVAGWYVDFLLWMTRKRKDEVFEDFQNGKATRAQYVNACQQFEQAEEKKAALLQARC